MASTSSTNQRPQSAQPGDGEVVSATRARQGFRDKRILYVLLGALALLIVGYLIAFAISPTDDALDRTGNARTEDPGAAAMFNAPEPAPKLPPSSQ